MAVFTVPGWLQNAGAVHTAAQFRSYMGSLMAGTPGSSSVLKSRGGIHPAMGNQLAVIQTGSPSMAVVVRSGFAWIPGTESGLQGMYAVANDGDFTVAISAAHASLPRIDSVQIRVRDSFYSGASDDAIIDVKTGTAASSPVAPSPDANSLVIANVLVGAGVTSITNANITSMRYYMAGVGGVINYAQDAAPPIPGDNMDEGQLLYAMDTDRLKITDGTTIYTVWDKAVEGASYPWTSFTPTTYDNAATTPTTISATVNMAKYWRQGKFVHAFADVTLNASTSNGLAISLPFTSAARRQNCGTLYLFGAGTPSTQTGMAYMLPSNDKLVPVAANQAFLNGTSGQFLRYSVTYETT